MSPGDVLLGQRESYLIGDLTMAGLFAKAAAKTKETASNVKKKATTWLVGDNESQAIGKAIHDLTLLEAANKANEAKMEVLKNSVKRYAHAKFVSDYVTRECLPESPMVVQNPDGEKVTYVVQDRTGQYGLKDAQKESLSELLGVDAAADLVYDETTFGFSREILSLPKVQDVVEKHLVAALEELKESKVLSEEQADSLLDVKVKSTLKPGVFERLTQICGRDVNRVTQFLEIVGSSITRYVKV